jgi:hypothetical protein
MKPVTHHIKPFSLERLQDIRMKREFTLAEGRDEGLGKGHKKSRKGTKSGTSKRKAPKVKIDANVAKKLEGLDPAMQAFLKKALQ